MLQCVVFPVVALVFILANPAYAEDLCPAHADGTGKDVSQGLPNCCDAPQEDDIPLDPIGKKFKALPQKTQQTAREICQQHYENLSQLLADAWSKRKHLNTLLAQENPADTAVERAQKEFDMAHSMLVQAEQDFKIILKERTGLTPADCATPACGPTR